MEKIFNKINNYLKKVGEGVEDFSYKLIFDGVMWTCEVEAISIDGEEDFRQVESLDLEELFIKIKEDI